MRKNLLPSLLAVCLILSSPGISLSAESQQVAPDYLTKIQTEISNDITKLRASIETELDGMSLTSIDVAKRIRELAALSETASDDMAAWGYTPEQRELHTRILSELGIAYSAYGAVINTSAVTASEDVSSLGNLESPDINNSDNLRQEIGKLSRGLDVQIFYLQSRINRLRLDLATASALQKQLKEAQDGGQALELPRTHMLELENARINAALSRIQVQRQRSIFESNVSAILRLRRRLSDMQGKLSFTQETLDAIQAGLKERIQSLTDEITAARKSLTSANSSLRRARTSLTASEQDANTSSLITARSARVSYWEYMIALLNEEITLTREAQDVWRERFRLFHDQVSGEEIWKLRDTSAARITELQRQLEGIETMESEIVREAERTQSLSAQEELSASARQNLIQASENYRKIITDIIQKYEALIPRAIFLQQRLNTEANDNLSAIRLAEKVSSFSYDTIMGFLNTELWQGEGYSVTVSKLTIAVFVLLSSFFLSSWGSKWIKRRIMKRAKASITAANAIQRITFYILWIAFALIALNIVDIPLTAFAFMGGAMAVGIGFGMQNIFNNLISGFIVIFSRPFKVNDIVEVAGTQGIVDDIGSRSTTIKTWDGLDVVLPNRYFLENSVTNWTGSDVKKREVLKVSVSYDADSRKVEKILLDVVSGHSQVLKNPAPFVIFKNFGDDGLEFEIYYWFELRKGSGVKISSDMRHHISAVFKREGIDIPYPQRVIHMAVNNTETPDDETGNESEQQGKNLTA